jgi:hypothetical protein
MKTKIENKKTNETNKQHSDNTLSFSSPFHNALKIIFIHDWEQFLCCMKN